MILLFALLAVTTAVVIAGALIGALVLLDRRTAREEG